MLTTHDLADIERLCNRILMIDRGRLIYEGSVEDLLARYGGERTLVVDLEEPLPPLDVPGARVERVDGPRQWLRFRRDETSAAAVTAAVAQRAKLVDLAVEEPDIEAVVRRIYTSQPREV
jgi:ABC-2 type transport system ATP-binding protein